MRPFGTAGLTLLLLAGCATAHEDHGPAEIPYACEAGGDARVVYWAGGASTISRARVTHGGHAYELTAAPSEYGLRYLNSDGEMIVTWLVNGETALLSWIPRDAPAGAVPREVTCPRRREAGGEAAAPHANEEPAHH